MSRTTLVNLKKKKDCDVYIGRPSLWGNPFQIGKDGDREEVIQLYKDYVKQSPELLKQIHQLQGKVLGCWCSPKPCHGNVLITLLKELGHEPTFKGFIR